jgi:hypothetical protein
MLHLSLVIFLLSLLVLIFSSFITNFKIIRPQVKLAVILSAIGVIVSLTLSLIRPREDQLREADAKPQTAAVMATEAENAKAAEIEKKKMEEQTKAASAARRAELLKPPTDQVRFIQVIDQARSQYKSGQTNFQKGAVRPSRAHLICAVLKSPRVEAWIGTIDKLSTIGDGDGVLTINIANKISVGTWNTANSDKAHNTIIKSKSSLYHDLLRMKKGDTVRIYGHLLRRDLDCYWEMNSTLDKSIEEPSWAIRFSRIDRVDLTSF